MRVITGKARGASLASLPGEATRPTGAKVKEGIFSALQFEMEGARVFDMFAGTGQMGIEALSRGAASCVFADSSREAADVIRSNLMKTRLSDEAEVFRGDAFVRAARFAQGSLDIVFVDPPYRKGLALKALEALDGKVSPGGCVVVECSVEEELPETVGGLSAARSYRYSSVAVTVYRADR